MILCIPVDGSAPFEVENDYRCNGDTLAGCLDELSQAWVNARLCRLESWRERAERLEKELAALHSAALTAYGQTEALDRALDTIAKRRESDHG